MEDLRFKVALITGGTKGIGYAVAESLLKQGVNVAITGRTEEGAKDAARQLNENENDLARAIGLASDVRSFKSQEEVVRAVVEEFGQLDIVIANAGIGHFASIEDLSVEKWQETIDTNLTGAFFSLKASVDQLIKNKGYYISISSLAGTNFFAGGAAYNASKFGLTGFSQAVMLDLRKHGVKVSTIMPGSVSTYFNGNQPKESDAWKIQGEDIGELVVDLLKMNERTLPSKIEVRPTMPPTH
ncbi:MAG: 3-oxoacyl-[acyl-carrier protein] reductase [Cyclobacteriaceae bacterium]|jgi:3-oxoacyl-[acyl-carrier protein] reductase